MTISIKPYLTCFRTKYYPDFSFCKAIYIRKKVNDRRGKLDLGTDSEYQNYLDNNAKEAAVFTYLEKVILPLNIEKQQVVKGNKIRNWLSEFASGQDAYGMKNRHCNLIIRTLVCLIFVSYISFDSLGLAQCDNYLSLSRSKVTPKPIQTYFSLKGEIESFPSMLKTISIFQFSTLFPIRNFVLP